MAEKIENLERCDPKLWMQCWVRPSKFSMMGLSASSITWEGMRRSSKRPGFRTAKEPDGYPRIAALFAT